MTSTGKSGFDPLLYCVNASLTPPSPCGRPHAIAIHIALQKQLVGLQWPSGPKAKMRLNYQCNFFETILLFIYITSLYWQKISTFYSIQRRHYDLKTNFFAWEEDRMTSVGYEFSVWTSTWRRLSSLVHRRPPEPNPTLPLRVDVISGWPDICLKF